MQILATTLALASVMSYSPIAEATGGTPLSWPAEYTTVGALLALLTYLTTKTGPGMIDKIEKSHGEAIEKMVDAQKECTTEMSSELKGLRGDLRDHQTTQIELLKSQIIQRPG